MSWFKRKPHYLVFVAPDRYPYGGMQDYVGYARSIRVAQDIALQKGGERCKATGSCEADVTIYRNTSSVPVLECRGALEMYNWGDVYISWSYV